LLEGETIVSLIPIGESMVIATKEKGEKKGRILGGQQSCISGIQDSSHEGNRRV